jgi:hypothetical protein
MHSPSRVTEAYAREQRLAESLPLRNTGFPYRTKSLLAGCVSSRPTAADITGGSAGPFSHAHQMFEHELVQSLVIAVGDELLGLLVVESASLLNQQ